MNCVKNHIEMNEPRVKNHMKKWIVCKIHVKTNKLFKNSDENEFCKIVREKM